MKYFLRLIGLVLSLGVLWINLSLHKPEYSEEETAQDIIKQLNFLNRQLKEEDLASKMQRLFPEGFIFIHALNGLAWSELALGEWLSENEKERAITEALYAYKLIDSEQGKRQFSRSMQPTYGIYYSGWRNYLLAKILSASIDFEDRQVYTARFKTQCEEIATAFNTNDSPYLSSYPGSSWPADSFQAMASLVIHDHLFEPKFEELVESWLRKVQDLTDDSTGMIAHQTDAVTGKPIESSRGGSMALMIRVLAEIDPDLAQQQYQHFLQQFTSTALGLPMTREYPKGVEGMGDIDSGPVILGTGFAATIVSIGTHKAMNNDSFAYRQFRVVHAFGLSTRGRAERAYLLGSFPMADAFIAWTRASRPLVDSQEYSTTRLWAIRFHLLSLLIISILCLPLYSGHLRTVVSGVSKRSNKKS